MNKSFAFSFTLSLFVVALAFQVQPAHAVGTKPVVRGTPVTLNWAVANAPSCLGNTSPIASDKFNASWYGSPRSGSGSAPFTPTIPGTYAFSCTYTNPNTFVQTSDSATLVVSDCTAPQTWNDGSKACVTPPVTCTAPQVLQNGVCVTTPSCTPTASLTIDGAHSATLAPGQSNTKSWSSTGGTSWSSSYVMSGTCNNQGSGSWSANTANGSVTNTANAANSGCTAVITYTVTNSSCVASPSASDSISVTTSATPTQNTPSGNITSNSCTISSGANSCAMNVAWSSLNTTGSVTVQRGYSPYGTIASGTSGNQSFTFSPSGTYTLDLYDGATKLATGSFTASCASGSTWNGSTCYAPVGIPSASISQSSTVSAPGEAVTISWSSSNVTSCAVTKTVNGGAPFLPFSWTSQPYPNTSGSGTATPGVLGTHTFYIDCTGPYGSASNSVTHTVANNPPPPPPAAQVTCTTTSSSCTSSATNSCGQTATGTTNITSCTDGSNSSTACSATPSDPIVSASISASPPRLPTGGGTATLSLSVSGANTCTIKKNSVVWKTLTSSSCSLPSSVSDPAVTTQTKYNITCSNATYSASASSKLVNVGALFNEF